VTLLLLVLLLPLEADAAEEIITGLNDLALTPIISTPLILARHQYWFII
jgi:hypothetical protein